jgi:hypothetical protein
LPKQDPRTYISIKRNSKLHIRNRRNNKKKNTIRDLFVELLLDSIVIELEDKEFIKNPCLTFNYIEYKYSIPNEIARAEILKKVALLRLFDFSNRVHPEA